MSVKAVLYDAVLNAVTYRVVFSPKYEMLEVL
jgi:hypothetical protein